MVPHSLPLLVVQGCLHGMYRVNDLLYRDALVLEGEQVWLDVPYSELQR